MPSLPAPVWLFHALKTASHTTSLPFLLPCFQSQRRTASILSSLSDNPSAYNKRIRRGRGPSSGKGKTAGRGYNGQKAHGKVPVGFEGGQTPLHVVKGKRGFENVFSIHLAPLNLDRLQSWVDQGRLDPSKPITLKELAESRCLHGVKDGVKILGNGASTFRTPINLLVSRASATAITAIEAAGGSVTTRYYTPFAIRQILRGKCSSGVADVPSLLESTEAAESVESVEQPSPSPSFTYRLPNPSSRKDIEYYRDRAHRGYLSDTVPWNEGPSLFFKPPSAVRGKRVVLVEDAEGKVNRKALAKAKGENRLW
ncbi:MAG: YmL10 [Piccolia ochrophora]|nr:MAG: YmL10 [Piccolia ochrophora]